MASLNNSIAKLVDNCAKTEKLTDDKLKGSVKKALLEILTRGKTSIDSPFQLQKTLTLVKNYKVRIGEIIDNNVESTHESIQSYHALHVFLTRETQIYMR